MVHLPTGDARAVRTERFNRTGCNGVRPGGGHEGESSGVESGGNEAGFEVGPKALPGVLGGGDVVPRKRTLAESDQRVVFEERSTVGRDRPDDLGGGRVGGVYGRRVAELPARGVGVVDVAWVPSVFNRSGSAMPASWTFVPE